MAQLTPGQYAQTSLTQYNYVFGTGIVKPSWDPNIVKRYGSQRFTYMMDVMGMSTEITAIEHNWTEEDRIMRKTVCTTAGAGAGVAATFTVATTSPSQFSVISQNSPYVTAATFVDGFTININDVIPIPPTSGVNAGTMVRVKVTAINPTAGTFTAAPLDVTQSVPALATATQLTILGGAFSESSQNPNPIDFRVNNYSNSMHTHRLLYKISRTAAKQQVWINDKDGKLYWTAQGESNAYKVFLNEVDMLALYSDETTNPVVSNPQYPTSTTLGVIPQVLADGYTQTYNVPVGVTVNDWSTFISGIELNKGAREYLGLMGGNFYRKAEKNLSDFFKNGAITYGNFTNDEAKRVNLDFKSFSYSGYTFNFKNFDLFNDYQTFAAAGYPFRDEALFLPLSGVETGGQKSFSVEMAYLQGDRMNSWVLNNLTQTAGGEDSMQYGFMSKFMCNVKASGQAAYFLAS
jgi:hypothetical protein